MPSMGEMSFVWVLAVLRGRKCTIRSRTMSVSHTASNQTRDSCARWQDARSGEWGGAGVGAKARRLHKQQTASLQTMIDGLLYVRMSFTIPPSLTCCFPSALNPSDCALGDVGEG